MSRVLKTKEGLHSALYRLGSHNGGFLLPKMTEFFSVCVSSKVTMVFSFVKSDAFRVCVL